MAEQGRLAKRANRQGRSSPVNEQVNAALDEELANAVRSLDPATPTPRPVRGVVLHTRARGDEPSLDNAYHPTTNTTNLPE